MAQITLVKGQVYRIRLTDGRWTDGKFLFEKQAHSRTYGYTTSRTNRHFMFENVRTGREIEIKSMQKIHEKVAYTQAPVASPVLDRDDTCVLCDAGELHEH